jgi:Protein of unknown function (DUF1566)
MKQAKLLLLFAFLLIVTVSVQAQLTAVPVAGIQKSTAHYIGEKYGGGIVFYITPDALHGLVAETKDQGNYDWWAAQDSISIVETHSTAGKNFTDWRVPTIYELNLLYDQRTVVGGFKESAYWSSTEFNNDDAWELRFFDNLQLKTTKHAPGYFRAIRAF